MTYNVFGGTLNLAQLNYDHKLLCVIVDIKQVVAHTPVLRLLMVLETTASMLTVRRS